MPCQARAFSSSSSSVLLPAGLLVNSCAVLDLVWWPILALVLSAPSSAIGCCDDYASISAPASCPPSFPPRLVPSFSFSFSDLSAVGAVGEPVAGPAERDLNLVGGTRCGLDSRRSPRGCVQA